MLIRVAKLPDVRARANQNKSVPISLKANTPVFLPSIWQWKIIHCSVFW